MAKRDLMGWEWEKPSRLGRGVQRPRGRALGRACGQERKGAFPCLEP